MSKEFWIFAEQTDGVVASSYYEMLSKAIAVYAEVRDKPVFTAVVIDGHGECAEALMASGCGKVISISNEKLALYNPAYYTAALCEAVEALKPETLLVAASAIGSELAPSVSARLKTGLAAHCTELKLDGNGSLHMIAPAFGGKLMGEYIIPDARPVMASIKPGVFERGLLEAKDAELVSFYADSIGAIRPGIELVERRLCDAEALPIEKAELVVCAGLGCALSGNLDKAKELAKRIGAGVCYTRPLADLGYYPNEGSMVGTSGKTIKPKFYIGFGVSGATQHICGVKDSRLIINVNNDRTAMCFDVSNYKVVADCGIILDELLKQI